MNGFLPLHLFTSLCAAYHRPQLMKEEDSFMDLLKYVYSNKLPTTFDVLDLLLTADQFVVDSCFTDCNRAFKNMPMTFESASVYLGLHLSLQLSPSVQTLVDAAKQFLTLKFKNLNKYVENLGYL